MRYDPATHRSKVYNILEGALLLAIKRFARVLPARSLASDLCCELPPTARLLLSFAAPRLPITLRQWPQPARG